MDYGHRVKVRREALGMSQEELAIKMGYSSRSSINKIENGRAITQKIIVRLAEALNTTPSYIMGWDQEEIESASRAAEESLEGITKLIDDPALFAKNMELWQQEVKEFNFTSEEMQKLIDYAKLLILARNN